MEGRVHYVVLQYSSHEFFAFANLDQLDPLFSSHKLVPTVSVLSENGIRAKPAALTRRVR